ncbi:transposase [Cucumis melo var. makuwa]|uniref:Transposase n=1 Tax=Cucumis melo var. makuwa TaxID=1194695 RepID=A0A5A7T5E5_CUCMM|nr:transposase [Cucumis melo var. makuwa]TYK20537.1 transposase [Cucumis melo var. makuwa]
MDSTDMELECDGSCKTSKIVRDEDTDVKRKTIDVDSYGREDVPNPSKIRKNVKQSMIWDLFERLKGDPNDPCAKCLHANIDFDSNENVGEDFVYDTIVEEFEVDATTPFEQGSSEIDIYLLEANVRTEGDFDILQWWKMNTDRFEVLGHMARDIFAISVSTVASESDFSTGGHVVDSSRCSLTPKIVEALICTQNWLNSDPIHLPIQHEFEDASKFEEGFQVVMENEKELEDLSDFDKLSITD